MLLLPAQGGQGEFEVSSAKARVSECRQGGQPTWPQAPLRVIVITAARCSVCQAASAALPLVAPCRAAACSAARSCARPRMAISFRIDKNG